MAMTGRRAALALGGMLWARQGQASAPRFLSAAADFAGAWRAAAFGLDGAPRFEMALPARGHGAAVSPDHATAVLFGRRPGAYALVIDAVSGRLRQRIDRATQRWFCGHGAFSADGALLYATELDAGGEGVVGVYAAGRDFARIGEFPTGGADPHEIRLARDGRHLWVANGGIRTDPRLPRARLDLEDIDSSVVLLAAASGQAILQRRLAEEEGMLSLRHLALGPDGEVFVAMQHEGPRFERPPLIAVADRADLLPLPLGESAWAAFDHYSGSAAATADGRRIAVTSPRGGMVAVFDARSRTPLHRASLRDICGIAPWEAGFVATTGLGGGIVLEPDGRVTTLPGAWMRGLRWDNHLVAL
jgi:hypothetical protein